MKNLVGALLVLLVRSNIHDKLLKTNFVRGINNQNGNVIVLNNLKIEIISILSDG